MDRVRERLTASVRESGLPISFSVGGVTFDLAPATIDEALREADEIIYRVKQGSKNGLTHERRASS